MADDTFLLNMAQLLIASLALTKMLFFNLKVLIFFLFLHKNICCGYSLKVPRPRLMSTHNICFRGEIKKYLDTHSYLVPQLEQAYRADIYTCLYI